MGELRFRNEHSLLIDSFHLGQCASFPAQLINQTCVFSANAGSSTFSKATWRWSHGSWCSSNFFLKLLKVSEYKVRPCLLSDRILCRDYHDCHFHLQKSHSIISKHATCKSVDVQILHVSPMLIHLLLHQVDGACAHTSSFTPFCQPVQSFCG